MMEELLPCPFCGSDEVEVVSPYDGQFSDYGTVKCFKCECYGPLVDMVGGYWKPIKAWNTRAQPKYKRVDLDEFILTGSNDYCDGNNKAIRLIKSKYGDLYILTKEGE